MIKIFPGAYHISQALSVPDQEYLCGLYLKNKNQFYHPKLASGYSMSLEMCCFGYHWNALNYKYSTFRGDCDQKEVLPFDPNLNQIAQKFIDLYNQREETSYQADYDICILNYYNTKSKLGLHQDNSESSKTLKTGHPVLSFSLGQSSIFRLGGLKRSDPAQEILLKNSDVIIFGGPSRLRYHQVAGLIRDENPPFSEELSGGRLNFTLRKI